MDTLVAFSFLPRMEATSTPPGAQATHPTSPTPAIATVLFLRSLISLKIYKENLCGYVGVVF
jgi:hypothetical protein